MYEKITLKFVDLLLLAVLKLTIVDQLLKGIRCLPEKAVKK